MIRAQLSIMFMSRSFQFVFSFVLAIALISYLMNALSLIGANYSLSYSWHYQYAGNTNSNVWNMMSILYPFIIVFPFGFSFIQDMRTGLFDYYVARAGRKKYFMSKMVVSFVGGALLILIPFLVNLLLCYMTFPHTYYSPLGYAQQISGEYVVRETVFAAKPFASLFVNSLLLYNLLYLAMFSLFSGLVAAMAMAFSFFIRRRRILLFIPLLIIFIPEPYISSIIYNMEAIPYINPVLLDYFGTDAFYGQSLPFIAGFILCGCAFIALSYKRAARLEYLT
jgi:MFS family permease